jgi:hypothetical protein
MAQGIVNRLNGKGNVVMVKGIDPANPIRGRHSASPLC